MSSTTPQQNTSTTTYETESHSFVGLVVGLPLLFVALVVIAVVLTVYFRRKKSVKLTQSDKFKVTDNNQDNPKESPYTGFVGSHQLTPQSPVYENIHHKPFNLSSPHQSAMSEEHGNRSYTVPGELYMPCDSQDDAIYSNDHTFNHFTEPSHSEEDIYIVPDA